MMSYTTQERQKQVRWKQHTSLHLGSQSIAHSLLDENATFDTSSDTLHQRLVQVDPISRPQRETTLHMPLDAAN